MRTIVETYSPKKTADMLGIPVSTIRAAVHSGELPAIRYNQRVWRITAVDAAAWYATKGGRIRSTTSTTPTTSPAP